MNFKPKTQKIMTYPLLNFIVSILGLTIVWLATHNLLGMIGAFISALHFQFILKEDKS